MTRISMAEAYDNKDVITQIYRLKDLVAKGTYSSVDAVRNGGDIVLTFTDQEGNDDVFTLPVNGITSITSTQSGSTVIVNILMDDGSVETFTFTATPGVTLDTAQTITGAKSFTGGLTVPTTPPTVNDAVNQAYVESTVAGVNNILHKSGAETKSGQLTLITGSGVASLLIGNSNVEVGDGTTKNLNRVIWTDRTGTPLVQLEARKDANDSTFLRVYVRNADGTTKMVSLAGGDQ